MKSALLKFSPFLGLALCLGCQPDPNYKPQPTPEDASVVIQIHHEVDGEALVREKTWYTNANGDQYQVYEYKYYLSNFQLTGTNGQVYAPEESYYLVDDADPESMIIRLEGVPLGEYDSISFLIGVDSLRNVSGAQTGALDPSHGMFWTWNTGYIMAAMMGTSPQAGSIPHNLSFHVGGFDGPHSVLRRPGFAFDTPLLLESGDTQVLNLHNNLNQWFQGAYLIDFSVFSNISAPGYGAQMLADNYANMFILKQ